MLADVVHLGGSRSEFQSVSKIWPIYIVGSRMKIIERQRFAGVKIELSRKIITRGKP